jgi:hypothetical protein
MEVADGIHRFGTHMVNWYLIERGGRLTLVDAGMRRFPPFRLYLRPTAWPLLAHGLRNGLLATPDAAEVRTFGDGDALEVPGRPRVRHLPGHTRGNCALHLPDASVVFSGDALVTFHPYRRRRGPRLLIKGVNEDNDQARGHGYW